MKKAFTLIELLTVMAISAVMMTLIVLPVFQSFNVLRTAQSFADAQDKARLLTEQISREVGNAVAVRNIGDTYAVIPGIASPIPLPYTKMDLIPPAQGDPNDKRNGAYYDPVSGKYDPTLSRPKGDVRLPVLPGQVYVRWWVGLNRPTENYNEPYTGLLMPRNGGRDNLYVLRRAEIEPFVYRVRKDGQGPAKWRPNLAYYHSDDPVQGSNADFDTRIIDLDDPYFFVADGKYLPEGKFGYNERVADPDKNNRVLRWAGVTVPGDPILANGMGRLGRSVLQTEVTRYDMIRPVVQGSPPQVVKTGGVASVVPLIQFRPTRVSATPATGNAAAKPGMGADGLDAIGPDTYSTEHGLWANAIVRYYPSGYVPNGPIPFEVASSDLNGGVTISAGGASGDGLDGIIPSNFALFDLKTYERMLARGDAYPFTAAAVSADQTDLFSPTPNRLWTPEESMRRTFTPFRVLTGTGKIVTSFGIEEVGTNAVPGNLPNLPQVLVHPQLGQPANSTVVYSAIQAGPQPPAVPGGPVVWGDTALATAPLSPISASASANNPYDVNRAFNRIWNYYPELQGTVQRFIDLRFVPNLDGTYSPLCPVPLSERVQGFSFDDATNPTNGSKNRVRIVPGSDEVYGPDQNPGPNYGSQVRYTRTTGNPGPNQYRLVYADLPEPTDYALLGLPDTAEGLQGFNQSNRRAFLSANQYGQDNIVSTQIQPRYKAGYLQLCSDPNIPLPVGPIKVRYRFAFNGPKDAFVVDHDTREVLQILLTVKNYPQANVPNAQTVTLKSTATLRNTLR